MKVYLIILAVILMPVCKAQEEISLNDYRFTMSASKIGLMQMKAASLAGEKGSSAEVKLLAQRIIKQQGKSSMEIKKLADFRGIFLMGDLDKKQQKCFDKLSAKKGLEFDKAYVRLMKKLNSRILKDFKKEIENGQDPELRDWAILKLPALESQLNVSEEAVEAFAIAKLEELVTYKD